MNDVDRADTTHIPSALAEIIENFSFCEGREKLEYLLEFAEQMPALPERLSTNRDNMQEVHECMTPVFVHGEVENGQMVYWFDVPPESPTVRGFAVIMIQGVSGQATPEEVLKIPSDFYLGTGLQTVLSGQRMNGMSTFLNYMKHIAEQTQHPSSPT